MLLTKLLEVIETEFPVGSALEGDPVGLRIQSGNIEVNTILIALELTDEVLNSAIELGCDCIVTFHPLIFNPLSGITDVDRVGRLTTGLIKQGITQITIHTNFDVHHQGTNVIFANLLGLNIEGFLIENREFANKGMGIIGSFNEPVSHNTLAELFYTKCNSMVKFSYGKSDSIKKVAIVCGSGSSFISEVLRTDCDAFITADVTYHNFHRVKGKLSLFDIGHYEMEQFVPEHLKLILDRLLTNENVRTYLTKQLTNPVNYFPELEILEKQNIYLNNQKGL